MTEREANVDAPEMLGARAANDGTFSGLGAIMEEGDDWPHEVTGRPASPEDANTGIKGAEDIPSDIHLYSVSRFYCQRLLQAMNEFTDRVTVTPLDQALFYSQEQEGVEAGKDSSTHFLKLLEERDKPFGETMVHFLERLREVKQELQSVLKDINDREGCEEAPDKWGERARAWGTDGASRQREAGIEEAVRRKRRLLEAMHFMADSCNSRLLQMGRIALGDPLHPGRALRLCPLDCSVLAVSLAPMATIEELNLGHCWIGPEGLQRLSAILPQCRSLRLNWNGLGDSGAKILCSALREPACVVRELWVDYNKLTGTGTRSLAFAVLKNQSLQLLSLSYNKIGEATMKLLCDALRRRCCTIQSLRLGNNKLTALCTLPLTQVLSANRSLTQLSLSYNRLSTVGLRRLCTALRAPACQIQKLELDDNGLQDSCAKELASALSRNQKLKALYLNRNSFSDQSIPAFSHLVDSCKSLRYLWLWRNQFSANGRAELQSLHQDVRGATVFV
ncbi:NACHT, LRR and PYD domains-containing protein 3-like isoform X2 [Stegostoma tigrinum]|uniref:NACHT, LRR and PYD domains-containing protein 3-like isoform X2 n=1 Tax=Stegostoma tigrinum TaxID=3053191 RepID=UPI0028705C52|nr:NACHT, LRR and PYD domains-containing protein 3-like isoform X2 [Stegostoma tigrinum]